jgi:hypothetical protein
MDIDLSIVEQTSASFLSNVFRYKMIKKTDAIWIDCDAFCHKPFPDEMQNIYAGHGVRGALNCGVLYIPPEGELIDLLLDYYENLPEAPPGSTKTSGGSWKNLPPTRILCGSTRPSAPHSGRRPLPISANRRAITRRL